MSTWRDRMHDINEAPECQIWPHFLGENEATQLFHSLVDEIPWDERMSSRKTACFGQTYDDSGVRYEFLPMPDLLLPLLPRCRELLGFSPTNCLMNYYIDSKSSMGFHSDATYNLADDTGIAILSLGSEREITFRSKTDITKLWRRSLPHGSLFYMSQLTQQHWTHAIKKALNEGPRISLTLRHILPPDLVTRQADVPVGYHR